MVTRERCQILAGLHGTLEIYQIYKPSCIKKVPVYSDKSGDRIIEIDVSYNLSEKSGGRIIDVPVISDKPGDRIIEVSVISE